MTAEELRAAWEAWADAFLKLPQVEMSEHHTKAFLACYMSDQSKGSVVTEAIRGNFPYQVLDKRMAYIGLKATDNVKAFISSLACNVGTVVMYAYALKYLAQKRGVEVLTMEDIVQGFPFGFPDQDSLQKQWGAQKGFALGQEFDNLLDVVPL